MQRYVRGTFTPPTTTSTIGASFLTKRTIDAETGTEVRLQIWDTAGQERFRAITKLYYRGASAVILVYSIVDAGSFDEMGGWLQELKSVLGEDVIMHVVGTKTDLVAQEPGRREVPFERCIAYVAENLYPAVASTPPPSAGLPSGMMAGSAINTPAESKRNSRLWSDSNRNSGFWGQECGWDVCHEISASSGEGIEEVFRVVTRKLVEKAQTKKAELEAMNGEGAGAGARTSTPGREGGLGYFDRSGAGTGSFRLTNATDKRRSWLGFPTPSTFAEEMVPSGAERERGKKRMRGGCC